MTSRRAAARSAAQLSLFGEQAAASLVAATVDVRDPDAAARAYAVDPANNVVLEASAGTGKTSVLVQRYLNLLRAGVDPANILAITFTRKAAAEMRERIIGELRKAARLSARDREIWLELRGRLGDVTISTIDAFCLSLLREFPLEADLDPGFGLADETEIPRILDQALDRSLRILTSLARSDRDVALVLAQLGLSRAREGLAILLERRLVARDALDRFLERAPADLSAAAACSRTVRALGDALASAPGGLAAFLADGPSRHPRYALLVEDIGRLASLAAESEAAQRGVIDRVAAHFLTQEGRARRSGQLPPYRASDYPTPDAARRHRAAVFQMAPQIERVRAAFARDLNGILARGIRRMFAIAQEQYRRALDERAALDFSDVLERAVGLLQQMDEFAQSRFRLESRYHHVLVDEFQDTSRAQWTLVSLLIQSWGEGLGPAAAPSIFVVGDRKQSIYRFRDADVSILQQAGRYIEGLRPAANPRRSIAKSFRAVPELLQFVNDLCGEMAGEPARRADDFTYGDTDRFPVDPGRGSRRGPLLGIAAAEAPEQCAAAVAAEIARLLEHESVRDRETGVSRPARPGDIAILFRSRTSHREFEQALERRNIPTYVYKGLGFFDADETKDVTALIRFLANPSSHLRAAAFLRSRFVRLSDPALAALAPDIAGALDERAPLPDGLDAEDRRVLEFVRPRVNGWLARVDRLPPADLLEEILRSSAYAFELRGRRRDQAWENLKKMRGMVRRIQNRGYATFGRLADDLDSLTAGDESNAVIEATNAVNLMTVHAAKGLEFPVVFVVNMAKGASGVPRPVRVHADSEEGPAVSIGPFVSEMDEAERERDRHESRRLLYVALTRARDRLYLSSSLKESAVAAGRGSLAEVLPPSVIGLLERAATTFPECDTIGWTSGAGNTFDVRVCHPPVDPPDAARATERESGEGRAVVEHPSPGGAPRHRVSDQAAAATGRKTEIASTRDALIGRLAHRLVRESRRLAAASTDEARTAVAVRLLENDGAFTEGDRAGIVSAALAGWRRLQAHQDLSALLQGEVFHEVPFSLLEGAAVVRGVIDCLIRTPDGGVLVVEFKSGAPHASHRIQLDVYVRAARSIFPNLQVEGRLVYL